MQEVKKPAKLIKKLPTISEIVINANGEEFRVINIKTEKQYHGRENTYDRMFLELEKVDNG